MFLTIRKTVIACGLVLLASAQASAELKYTLHMEVKKSDAPATPGANPIVVMMGERMRAQILPEGAADLVYIIGEKGTRVEYLQAAMGQPAGTVALAQPDGTLLVLNAKDRTYWRTSTQAAAAAAQAAGIAPRATAKPTGEFDTVAGVKCERVLVDVQFDLPIPEAARATLPPDFPTVLAMTGQSCVARDRFQKYGELAAKSKVADFVAAMGLGKIVLGGIVMRQLITMAGTDILSTVTAIGEEAVPAELFEVPAGYTEIKKF